jgi:hypothetical protein
MSSGMKLMCSRKDTILGHAVVVKVLFYKPEGREFETR